MMKKMKAAVFYGPRDLRLEEVDIPTIKEDEVLIKVKFCGICGTDPHIYSGVFPIPHTPIIPGHEFSGEVVQIGENVETIEEGERVTADINMECGTCFFCRNNQKLLCPEIKQIGVHVNGAFAEYVKAPEGQIYQLPDSLKYEDAALIEPLACSISGIEKSHVTLGNSVLILGGGTMGLLLLQLAKLKGASTLILSEIMDNRRKIALEQGADLTLNPQKQNVTDEIKKVTEGRGVDIVIEAIGNLKTYEQAFQLVRRGGRITVFGAAPADGTIAVSPFDIYRKELSIAASYAGTYQTWLEAISLLTTHKVKVDSIITNKIPLNSINEGYKMIREKKDETIKILVSPEL